MTNEYLLLCVSIRTVSLISAAIWQHCDVMRPVSALTPHVGSATVKSRTDMATLTARNILAALDGSDMPARLC